MSRFMLAYKNVVNKIDDINTMIFDEIDAGLSGSMAQTVAQSKRLVQNKTNNRCITFAANCKFGLKQILLLANK